MSINLISDIGDILISNGVELLGKTVKGTTELGLRKLSDFVKEKTGIDISSESAVSNLSSDQLLELKQLENEYEFKLMEYNLQISKTNTDDTISARDMQKTALINEDAGYLAKNFIYLYAIFWSIFAVGYLASVTFIKIPDENLRVVDTILGFLLGTIVSTIIGFFFGNSLSLNGRTGGVFTRNNRATPKSIVTRKNITKE